MSACDLIDYYEEVHGFMAGHIAAASKILREMVKDAGAVRILSFTGNVVATGLRGLIAQMLREKLFDVVITTCGSVDHDVAKSLGGKYYAGEWIVDDSMLREINIHRLGNVFIPAESYGLIIESFARKLLDELVSLRADWSPSEILREAGKRIEDERSILRSAYESDVPIIVPGIFDGAFGTQIVVHSQFSKLTIDLIRDERKLLDVVFSRERVGALIVGGGISKHHAIWFAQFRDGLDYAIYVTTAVEYDGSLSGAHPREAISWNKLKPSGKSVVVHGDATVVLPLIYIGSRCPISEK